MRQSKLIRDRFYLYTESNLELENRGAEKAMVSLFKTFCVVCLILIAITLI